MNRSVLTINSGSSSIKASLFSADGSRRNFRYEHVRDQQQAFDRLLHDLAGELPDLVGHRFVHGGDISDPARRVDDAEHARLQGLVHLAPLHLPGNLLGLDLCLQRFDAPQIACFDTAFHTAMPDLAKRLPIPNELGLRRFGFHGLNYAYIAKMLAGLLGEVAYRKVVVAHLGSGASLCLMENLKSVDTSMGYTPAGGIPMGTRSGDLDPGVMLELAKRYGPEELSDMVFHKMGLLALSGGEGSEMNELLSSRSEHAQFAVEYFCRQVRAAIGGFAAKAGGIDALVFTGGIGEHAAEIREKICEPLTFLGFALDRAANRSGANIIGLAGHKPVLIIPADEEVMIRDLCLGACR
ncbi:acetate/propionate family kinase [Candidatus Methylobacter oryzae]|uniref:Acetate kinase n=1 Tax=Candidatus Methylobacter oryzae TaxID=2497749 RepID=A0ABY3C763_9GAMM|nr:acetate kinase [Candidatus Methylobacter oryzae]TRW90656.1 acetate kinase [Candidatus Methylobacter oryzae]